ncbi:MAG: MBL fold metallo-hydrolase [Myxococcales bacterium]|nr:MBL fold metallo-hydrolase [Myxococcales bacterium]
MSETSVLDELRVGGLTLAGITRGGVETCIMVKELGVMFDVGMCPPGALKFATILVSHGHADHMGGLPYLVSQHGLMSSPPPVIHMPADIVEPTRQILALWSQIEDFELKAELHGHQPGDRPRVGQNLNALALRTSHRVTSLAWLIERTSHRLRPEFVGREPREIATLRAAGEVITDPHTEPLLCVTGDTRIEFFDQHELARRCRVLVHEVTSWDERRDVEVTRRWGHTHLDEVVARAEQFTGEALVLVHRSMRHTRSEAEALVQRRFPAAMRDRVHVFGR